MNITDVSKDKKYREFTKKKLDECFEPRETIKGTACFASIVSKSTTLYRSFVAHVAFIEILKNIDHTDEELLKMGQDEWDKHYDPIEDAVRRGCTVEELYPKRSQDELALICNEGRALAKHAMQMILSIIDQDIVYMQAGETVWYQNDESYLFGEFDVFVNGWMIDLKCRKSDQPSAYEMSLFWYAMAEFSEFGHRSSPLPCPLKGIMAVNPITGCLFLRRKRRV